ncbi:hypothetical protein pqer_cds_511 [Pandoravirus quercus]|uniref:Ankyrin repeat domain containing protein n=2 Tax=Pandoravirus TaxID=2060084 RepID=A0A2U7U920_9VIRU|nr:hypothetical protein pqer_cds_511 [Pandoravirus quercus]AVK74933.1 hypothetical protein pqer_cds_511 [Pandoravirus quercus]QBZ81120.1 hypothetical protein pclt_cds_526 [Pandoravirus celtis]
MEVSCIVDLPDELVLCILDIVDDATFCALRLAHPRFNLYDDAQVERKRKVPHWAARDPAVLCARGIAGGVRLWLDSEHSFTDDDILGAIGSGHVDVAALFPDRICDLDDKATAAAVRSDSVAMARLVGALVSFTVEDVNESVWCGSVEMVRFLATEVRDPWPESAMTGAAERGDMDVIQTVWRHHSECMCIEAVKAALEAGHTDVALFFAAEAVDPALVAAYALPVRNMDVIAQLHAHLVSQSHIADAIAGAARRGRTDVIALLASRCTEPSAIRDAAREAARHGNAEAALMLVERCYMYPLDDVLLDAAKGDSYDIIDVIAHRCSNHNVVHALHTAIDKGNDRAAVALLQRCSSHMFGHAAARRAMVNAATSGMKRTVAMLYDGDRHEDELFADAVAGASRMGHAKVVRFFIRKRPRSPAYTVALRMAAEARHAKVVQLFLNHNVDPMHALACLVHGGAGQGVRLLAEIYGNRLWPADCPGSMRGQHASPPPAGGTVAPSCLAQTLSKPAPIDLDPIQAVCVQCCRPCKHWLLSVALDGAGERLVWYLMRAWGWGLVMPG